MPYREPPIPFPPVRWIDPDGHVRRGELAAWWRDREGGWWANVIVGYRGKDDPIRIAVPASHMRPLEGVDYSKVLRFNGQPRPEPDF